MEFLCADATPWLDCVVHLTCGEAFYFMWAHALSLVKRM